MRSRARFLAATVGVFAAAGTFAPGRAAAAWDNAFQVACWNCRKPRVSNYAPAPVAAPQRVERLPDIVECTDEPVTVMRPVTEQVPVETIERRSFYEPVTTYTTRSYYDPKTCQTETVRIPRTSMVRREECNTVTKYMERVREVPVQTTRKVCKRTPVTQITQYGPTTASVECDSCQLPQAGAGTGRAPQAVVEPGRPPRAVVEPSDRIQPGATIPTAPPGGVSAPKSSRYNGPVTSRTVGRSARVEGEVVLADRQTPKPNTKVIFLNKSNLDDRVEATTDGYGQFDAAVPAGDWYLYVGTGTGRASYTNVVSVGEAGKTLTVVSK